MPFSNAASAATLALCLVAMPAAAQDAVAAAPGDPGRPQVTPTGAGNPAAPAADTESTAGEIIVTAQKRNERLLNVPISITALSGAAVVASGAKNLVELQGLVPGIYFSGNTGYSVTPIAIRGTSGTGNALADEPVAVYVDGVFQNAQTISTEDFLDLRSVEVVRGPQGTLQGRNSTAGALLIHTADPEDALGGYIRLSVADPTEYRGQAAITGPLTDHLSARFAVGFADELGWGTNTVYGTRAGSQRNTAFRGVLLWTMGTTRVRASGGYSDTDASVALARFAATTVNPTGQAVILGVNATPTTPLTAAQQAAIFDGNFALNTIPRAKTSLPYGTLEASHGFDGVDLVSITGGSHLSITGQNDSDGLALTDRYGYNRNAQRTDTLTEEVRLQSSGTRRFSWILGAYYSHIIGTQDIFLYNIMFTAPRNQYLRSTAHQVNDAIAGFADATFKITPELSATGGVRYTHETKVFTRTSGFFDAYSNALFPFLPNGLYAPPTAKFNNVSYRAKLAYQPTADVLLYASHSNGFKSGGFNALGNDPAFQPEKLYSSEIGAKLNVLDHHLTVTGSGYHNIYSNLQVTAGVPQGGVAIYNAASAEINGGELEANARLNRFFAVIANVAYTDGTYSRFPNAQNIFGAIVNASGNRLARSPKWQYYIQPSVTTGLGPDWSLSGQLSYRWRSSVVFFPTDQNASTLQSGSFGELGARISVTSRPLDLTASLFATNLNNARAVTNEQSLFNYPVAAFNRPRSVGVQLEKTF